jgi:hypothetical protein
VTANVEVSCPHARPGERLSARARRAVVVPALVGAQLAGVSGCGGDDGPKAGSDEAKILDLARSVVTARSGDAICRTQLTDDFVSTVFGDIDTCESAGADSKPEDDATGAAVTAIAVDGDSATAVVTEQGGAADGATGTWAFARDAAGWRVSDWQLDYLRSDFRAQFGPAYRADGPDDPFADAAVRGCVSDRFQGLADPEFRSTAYAILRGSDSGDTALAGWYYDCISAGNGGDGISSLRRIFEDGLRQADQIPPKVIECVVQTLRRTVTDQEIRAMGESGAAQTPPAIQKRIQRATVDCVDSTGTAS